jgi:hypothetical protein
MDIRIEPHRSSDVPELSRFLTEGFGAPADARFARPEILRWKYLDKPASIDSPRGYTARADGKIVGHVGFRLGSFVVPKPGSDQDVQEISTLHIIDWLALPEHRGLGARLMMRAHRHADTQFGLGTTAAARAVGEAFDYQLIHEIPIYRRTFKPMYRLREGDAPFWKRSARAARDAARNLIAPAPLRIEIESRRVDRFGEEIVDLWNRPTSRFIRMSRSADMLNYLLRFPEGSITGRLFVAAGEPAGCGIVSVVPRGNVLVGKIVECRPRGDSIEETRRAIVALTAILRDKGADFAECWASDPELAAALEQAGYFRSGFASFHVRDRKKLIPRDIPFYMTPLEADYAYT